MADRYSQTLEDLGWTPFFEAHLGPYRTEGCSVGRVAVHHRDRYVLYTGGGELWGEVTGKLRHGASGRDRFPAVGDWVVIRTRGQEREAMIHHVLPRTSKISRKLAGEATEEQVLAANIDVVFIVAGLDGELNLRRVERYLALAWESGALPVIILNKADIYPKVEEVVREVEFTAAGVSVLAISAATNGVEEVGAFVGRGKTGALLGSSGVGKSTISNLLVGAERQRVTEVRENDRKGRHITARRELLLLPNGGMVIDTPGMRELQLWGSSGGSEEVFEDITQLARECRFRDCGHRHEPDCAVKRAQEAGLLAFARLESYRKLQNELRYLERKTDRKAVSIEKQRWKKLMKVAGEAQRRKGR